MGEDTYFIGCAWPSGRAARPDHGGKLAGQRRAAGPRLSRRTAPSSVATSRLPQIFAGTQEEGFELIFQNDERALHLTALHGGTRYIGAGLRPDYDGPNLFRLEGEDLVPVETGCARGPLAAATGVDRPGAAGDRPRGRVPAGRRPVDPDRDRGHPRRRRGASARRRTQLDRPDRPAPGAGPGRPPQSAPPPSSSAPRTTRPVRDIRHKAPAPPSSAGDAQAVQMRLKPLDQVGQGGGVHLGRLGGADRARS